MNLISLVLTIAIFGVIFYLIDQLPMPPLFHTLIRVVVVIVAIVWLLQVFGVTGPSVPRLR